MTKLFESLRIREITLKNRIVVSSMCQYSSEDGLVNDWHLVHLGSRAAGGAGLVMSEATAVTPEGRITPGDAGIWDDVHIGPWKKVFSFIKSQGAVPGIQLAHAGRKGSAAKPWEGGKSISSEAGWETLAPSAIAFGRHLEKVPREMELQDIKTLVQMFGNATERAYKAGAELLEIHAGHGYLINEFLSPISNKRKDNYGGSFENRIRLLIEITEQVRANWPSHLPLSVRLSASDWDNEGWTPQESAELSKILKSKGVDLIDASSGFISPPHTAYPMAQGWQVFLSEKIKSEAGILTGTVGKITDPSQAEEILQANQADLIYMATEYLRNPNWPLRAAKELNFDVTKVGAIQITHWLK